MLISSFSVVFTKTIGNLIKTLNFNIFNKFGVGYPHGRRNKFGLFHWQTNPNHNGGFTLVEVFVTMGILIVFSGILVGYNQSSSKQLILISNQAKLVSLISRAKSLSMATLLKSSSNPGDPVTCAYGVHVDKNSGEIFIFQDLAIVDCSSSDNIYSGDSEKSDLLYDLSIPSQPKSDFSVLKLDSKIIEFMPETDLSDVVFIPPDPKVIINNDITKLWAQIGLKLKNSDASKIIIKVNNVGQISTR